MTTYTTTTGGLSTISRGRFFQKVDEHLESPTFEHLEALRRGTALFQIGLDERIVVSGDRVHVTQHILGSDWWGNEIAAVSEPVLRAAYIHAIEVSLAHGIDNHAEPLPIRSLWMAQADSAVFEVHVVKSASQVTLVLVTPMPEDQEIPPVDRAVFEDTWVIGTEERLNEVRDRYPEPYRALLGIEKVPGDPGPVARKMRGVGF